MAIPFNSSRSTDGSAQNGVQTRHPDAAAAEVQNRRIADVLAGTDTVRNNARLYIPQTVEHKEYPETFDAMLKRTSFTNYTSTTVNYLLGMIFRKEPAIKVPPRYKPLLENINNTGNTENTFAKKLCIELLCYNYRRNSTWLLMSQR
jgi:hypothetical protein